jgi:hypothetical protein
MSDLASGDTFLTRQALADGANVVQNLKRTNDPNNLKAADYLEGACDLARSKIGDSASDPQSAYDCQSARKTDPVSASNLDPLILPAAVSGGPG